MFDKDMKLSFNIGYEMADRTANFEGITNLELVVAIDDHKCRALKTGRAFYLGVAKRLEEEFKDRMVPA